jgi:hypothetical protein
MKKTWYRNVNLKPLGPFTLDEMRALVHAGEVGPQSLICDESQGEHWKAASEWGVFELTLFPAVQAYIPGQEFDIHIREWVVLVEQDGAPSLQEGPFSISEILERLQAGTLSPYQHAWKAGLSGWCQLKDRPEFYSSISSKQLSLARP